ncbi:hypothetical protein FLA_3474 [Filimonas lacunae]|nr:hypothetical protein FLA_3474 [Filimonas lacunae]
MWLPAFRPVAAQDYSNKGKDFWLCFPAHLPVDDYSLAQMSVFVSSSENSSGKITVNGYTTTFTVNANQVSAPIDIPYSVANISNAESGRPVTKGIHITVDEGMPPVVVFAHVYAAMRSAAMLVLPTNVLGKKYYSMNFYQRFKSDAYSQFNVVATEDATTVRYQLRINGILNGSAVTVNLPHAGDVLQIQNRDDLTGSIIESVSATGTEGCKRIAVFSGSSAVAIKSYECTNVSDWYYSFDPLLQQCYPVNSWGKEYALIPFADNPKGFHPRVMACEDNTEIDFGGITLVLNEGEYFPLNDPNPFPLTMPVAIKAKKPIAVAEYMMMAYCAGNTESSLGDPDMVLLNPVEQNIKDISLFSSNLESITAKYINVYMPTVATGSFRINGQLPQKKFAPMVPANGYSWLTESLSLSQTAYRLTADTGFNAIAYGMGKAESYAYSAGSYVKDRYQFLQVANQEGIANRLAACKGIPFDVYMTFPYQPLQITWKLPGIQPDVVTLQPVPDSKSVMDGKTLYRYKMPGGVTIAATGTYTAGIAAVNPTTDGCGGSQEMTYDITIIEPPVADFTYATDICNTQQWQFTYTGTQGGSTDTAWRWRLGDGSVAAVQHPRYTYPQPGTYMVGEYTVNDIGCHSATVEKIIVVDAALQARFSYTPACVKEPAVFTGISTVPDGYTVTQSTWSFGDGAVNTITANDPQTHVYAKAGSYKASLQLQTANGCKSNWDTTVEIQDKPVFSITPSLVYLPDGNVTFTATSNVAVSGYAWDFGDGGSASGTASVKHTYHAEGVYQVAVNAVTVYGCSGEAVQEVRVAPAPVAPVVPNVFSPNGDGVHDYWDILFLDRYTDVTVQVFNRWGAKVFSSKGYSAPWNGRVNGKALPPGTYYYIIETGGATGKITGAVTIIQ